MSGIVFLKTQNITELSSFYKKRIDMAIWLLQDDCVILRHGNMLLGFCGK